VWGFESPSRHQCSVSASSTPSQTRTCPDGNCTALGGDLAGHFSVWVNGNWRLTFTFEGEDAVLVDYQDYH
jgi:toxin HigB-1